MANQPHGGFQRLADLVFVSQQLVFREQPLITSVNQVIEHFNQGSLRDSRVARELLVAETTEAFGDVARGRSRRIGQLLSKPKFSLHLWPSEKHVDQKLHLVR